MITVTLPETLNTLKVEGLVLKIPISSNPGRGTVIVKSFPLIVIVLFSVFALVITILAVRLIMSLVAELLNAVLKSASVPALRVV